MNAVTLSNVRFFPLSKYLGALLSLLFFCSARIANAQETITVAPNLEHFQITDQTYWYSDTTMELSAGEVVSIPMGTWNKGTLNGYSGHINWVLIPFENKSDSTFSKVFYLSNAISHKVDLYFIVNGELQAQHIPSGLARSSKNKLYNDPGYPYEVNFPAQSKMFILAKIYDPLSSIQLPFHLLSKERAFGIKDRNLVLLFFWLGILVMSVVLSALLFWNTRQRMFLFYTLFALATGAIITSTTGMVTMFIDADPYQIVTNYYQWGAVLLLVFMPRFINSLVPIFSISPNAWKVMRVLGYIGVGIAILYCFPFFKFSFFFTRLFINTVVGLTALTFLYILVMLVFASVRKMRRAMLLFFVYVIYLSLGFVNVIMPLFGLGEENLNSIHIVLAGSAFETLAFMIFMGQATLAVYRDRQQLLEQVRDNQELVMEAIVKGQEQERNRFARDLHDGFGQMISALNLNLNGLKSIQKSDVSNRMQIFDASNDILKSMHAELKNICFDLMPQTLIKHGLDPAIREFASRINSSGQKTVEVHSFGLESRLSDIQEISLYRIGQEWINNILKYSDATHIVLQVTRDDSEITLMIEDNGQGFDKQKLVNSNGNGWKNMNSRANLISGVIELDTNENVRGNTFILNAAVLVAKIERQAFLEKKQVVVPI